MKISTLSTIISTLNSINFDNPEVMAELVKELSKAETADARKVASANAKTKEYEAVWPLVADTMTTETPVTLAELWASICDDVPEGFTKGKLSYAMTHQWVERVEKHEGKVNSYTLKV